jgi:hypothetical protein
LKAEKRREHRLDRQTTATGKERLLLLYWLKIGIVNSRQDLVKLLHKSEATITRWLSMYKSGGLRRKLRNKIPEPSTHIVGNINVVGGDNKGSGILFPRKRLTALLEIEHAPGNPNSIPAEAVSRLKERLKQPQGFS